MELAELWGRDFDLCISHVASIYFVMGSIKLSLVVLLNMIAVSETQAQAWPQTQTFGNDTLSIVTTADCDSRHEGSVRAVFDVLELPVPVGHEHRVALYRIESDGRFHHLFEDTIVGFVFNRQSLLAKDYKLRWYYDGNCYVEAPFKISNTPPVEVVLKIDQSTEAESCQDGGASLIINRTMEENYWTSWSNGYERISLAGLHFDATNSEFKAGNWHVELFGREGCDAYITPSDLDGNPVYNPIAELDFTIDCCIKNPTPPSIRYVTHPEDCNSSNGGFSVFGGAPPANNLGYGAFEWIVTDVYGNWVPPTDGDSGPNYVGLPAGDYTFEAITDEMYDDDVFEGCEMPTRTFRLGVDCE